ncbi:site-specific DNA-methyltransferase, partial [Zoogloea sp.]|uniref:site-specific DNA-methyltransferase n=1 Tax=Zoogloea sp. TaxID=49181 RepID=UPI001AC6110D
MTEQVLRAYEHQDDWVNRLVMGDSLVVLNSLLHYENMGGKVQMIYMDPPYGVKFGSNFQPFVRKREVGHGVDEEMTREPEMVQAYRDTWELGLHSYLAYLRDRLVLCRELLSSSGSVFVQIGEENLHHVRELMDEVLGNENYVSTISVKKTATPRSLLDSSVFYVIWYAKDAEHVKYNPLFVPKPCDEWARDTPGGSWGVEINGKRRPLTPEEKNNTNLLPAGAKVYCLSKLTSAGAGANDWAFEIDGKQFKAGPNAHWKTTQEGMQTLIKAGRIEMRDRPWFVRFHSDYVVQRLTNIWEDTAGKAAETVYVVQTQPDVVQRCILMTTDPGDLVIDPTCGSGTTALAAELWGRRWITCDVSRVPLALARQRLLTATYPFHELKQPDSGPAGGFVYKRKKNSKGEDVGGIIPHITLGSIANNEPEEEVVIVDRPETQSGVMRVTGPFTFEATIPTALDPVSDQDKPSADDVSAYGSYVDRMIEVLKKSPVLQLPGKKSVTFKTIRVPAKTLSLSAEATVVNGKERPCALVFGPENGAVSERMVHEAAREAAAKKYEHLYVIAFAIQPNARELVEHCDEVMGIPATYVQATPDLLMGDLLKNMRSSQIFSVCGLPEISVKKAKGSEVTVKLLGLDVFDPVSMETHHRSGGDVPAWFLDSDYNGLSFHVTQAFFPRTQAWDNLKKALKADF